MLVHRVDVGWTMNTSVPRMFSSIWNETSLSCRGSGGQPASHAPPPGRKDAEKNPVRNFF
jgi:hypothetical protein